MTFISIMNWDAGNRVTKYKPFDTLAEAEAHAAKGVAFPGCRADAFAVEHTGGGPRDWVVDPVAKTVSVVPLPPPPEATSDEIYNEVMRTQRVFKAYALAVNDGSVVPGAKMAPEQLKAAVKAKM